MLLPLHRLFRQCDRPDPCASLSGNCSGTGNMLDYLNETMVKAFCTTGRRFNTSTSEREQLGLWTFGCWEGIQSNLGEPCWDSCDQKVGACPRFCGLNGLCCKPGANSNDCAPEDGTSSYSYQCVSASNHSTKYLGSG